MEAGVEYPHVVQPVFLVVGRLAGEFLVFGVVMSADLGLDSWRWYEGYDLFVAVYFEPALTDCLVDGSQELVAALVLDWWCVSDCVLEDSFEGFPV